MRTGLILLAILGTLSVLFMVGVIVEQWHDESEHEDERRKLKESANREVK